MRGRDDHARGCRLPQVGIAEALELLHQDDVVFVDTRDPSEVVKTGAFLTSPSRSKPCRNGYGDKHRLFLSNYSGVCWWYPRACYCAYYNC